MIGVVFATVLVMALVWQAGLGWATEMVVVDFFERRERQLFPVRVAAAVPGDGSTARDEAARRGVSGFPAGLGRARCASSDRLGVNPCAIRKPALAGGVAPRGADR